MDNISNLTTNLPPTKPITETSVDEVQSELTAEFKNAAKSVASLYKLSLQRNSTLRHQGYLDAINDVINVIKNGGDVENWVLEKKVELCGELGVQAEQQPNAETATIPEDYKFSMSCPTQHKFPPTMAMPSMEHKRATRVPPAGHAAPSSSSLKASAAGQISQQLSLYTQEDDEEEEFLPYDGSTKRRLDEHKLDKRPKY